MERTDQSTDAVLRRILTEPSHAARVLTGMADLLERRDPFLVLNADDLEQAAVDAGATVLQGLPRVVAQDAADRAAAALPDARHQEIGSTYAGRLRVMAGAL